MIEEWRDIQDYENYQVSNMGRVRNKKFNRVLINSYDNVGYYRVVLSKNGKSKGKRIHRLMALAFIENTQNKPQINHKDGDKFNNNLDNLEWCTASENGLHSFAMGLSKISEKNRRDTSERLKGIPRTLEVRMKVSKSHMGISHICSNETKKKISQANMGRVVSQETRDKIGKANRLAHQRKMSLRSE